MERIEGAGGFTLIEVMIAIVVLTVGVMSLVGVMAVGLQTVGASSNMLIAREKAREAVESVHSARDTGELAWGKVRNVSDGGVFLNGMKDVKVPGNDGLINTADDGAIEVVKTPGPDGILGNSDDVSTPLLPTEFQREVLITTLNRDGTDDRQSQPPADHRPGPLSGAERLADVHADHIRVGLLMIRKRHATRSFVGSRLLADGADDRAHHHQRRDGGDADGPEQRHAKPTDTVMQITRANGSLRSGMDLMFTDLLQAGAGLPKGHVVQIPSAGLQVRRPGPPTTAYTFAATDLTMPAVIPGAQLGPTINGVRHRHDHHPARWTTPSATWP